MVLVLFFIDYSYRIYPCVHVIVFLGMPGGMPGGFPGGFPGMGGMGGMPGGMPGGMGGE